MPDAVAQAGPLGGASNELGGELRAHLGAYVASFGLRGLEVRLGNNKRAWGTPAAVRFEVDEAVDDLEIIFTNGQRVLIQVKRHLDFSFRNKSPLANVVNQWIKQCSGNPDDSTPLLAVAGSAAKDVRILADALDRQRDVYSGAPTQIQKDLLQKLSRFVSDQDRVVLDTILERASIVVVDLTPAQGIAVAVGLLDGNVVEQGQGQAAFNALANAVRTCAGRRSGLDGSGWSEALRGASLQIRSPKLRRGALLHRFNRAILALLLPILILALPVSDAVHTSQRASRPSGAQKAPSTPTPGTRSAPDQFENQLLKRLSGAETYLIRGNRKYYVPNVPVRECIQQMDRVAPFSIVRDEIIDEYMDAPGGGIAHCPYESVQAQMFVQEQGDPSGRIWLVDLDGNTARKRRVLHPCVGGDPHLSSLPNKYRVFWVPDDTLAGHQDKGTFAGTAKDCASLK